MCAVSGPINIVSNLISSIILKRMTVAIAHSYAEGVGYLMVGGGGIDLVSRCLAIFDLFSAGHNSIISAGRRYFISCNGKTCNTRALRIKLEVAGFGHASKMLAKLRSLLFAYWGRVS